MRLLCLGDSYTVGEALPAALSWPQQFAQRLTQRLSGLAGALSVKIIAQTGWSTDELLAAIHAAQAAGELSGAEHDFVSLAIGVNNQYRGRSVDNFQTEFSQLLSRALEFAGGNAGRVWLLSIPDWGQTPFAAKDARTPAQIAKQIDAFNAAIQRAAHAVGCGYVDITPLGRTGEPSLIALDGLHPSEKAYTQWVDLLMARWTQANAYTLARAGLRENLES